MKLLSRVLATGAALAILYAPVSTQQPVAGQPDLKVGDTAPDFTLPASDGQYVLAREAQRQVRRPCLVPQGVHRRLNRRMPGPP